MPKLKENYASKLPPAKDGTHEHWYSEVRGFRLFVGKRSKTWYYQRDSGGRTRRFMINRHPVISAAAARQTALGYALERGRGAGTTMQMGQ